MQTTKTHSTTPVRSRRSGRFILLAACAAALTASAQAERSYVAWAQAFSTEANVTQNGLAVAMDRRGNVATTGYTFSNGQEIYYTIKYDGLTGQPLWGKPFNRGFGNNRPSSIACDSKGNVIVTGRADGNGTGFDYYTIKYDGATGDILWEMPYSNSSGADEATKVLVDGADDVIVTGKSFTQGKQEDIYTIKYAALTGTKVWDYRYNSVGNFADKPAALFIDANNNVAVAGSSRVGNNQCFYTLKLSSAGAKLLEQTFDGPDNQDDYATGVAIDPAGNVIVTGTMINSGGTYAFKTIKYNPNGSQILWSQTFNSPDSTYINPTGVVVDGDGNVFVAGSSRLDNFKITFYTVRYNAEGGDIEWETRSPAEGETDTMFGLGIDGSGNPIVSGSSYSLETGYDFYAAKYDNASGATQWEQYLDGRRGGGTDNAYGLAVDRAGNVALVGTGQKPNGSAFSEMLTTKINHFLLSKGDPISGPGLTELAVISAFNVPSLADNGSLAAKVTVKDGKKSHAAVLSQGNGHGNLAFARQTQPAPNASPAVFKSFTDPMVAPDGSIAFSAKLSGVSGSMASGVWTDTFNGTLQCALQLGKQVPGLAPGVLLKSVSNISLRNGYLVALVTVKGTGVTSKNSTVIVGLISPTVGYELLRTDKQLTVDNQMGLIRKLSFFTPPKTSPGQGRYHGDNRIIAVATLDDKRTVVTTVSGTGAVVNVAASGGDAGSVIPEANWKSFGPPCVGGNGFYFATLATLNKEKDVVSSSQDTAIVYSFLGGAFTDIAVESGTAPGSNGGTYVAFKDPVSNDQGRYAFLATAKGGDFDGTKMGLWFGTAGAPNLVTRVGLNAPDGFGANTEATFSAISNLALPNGVGSGPLFLATVKGGGASKKNNAGLWGMDGDGYVRQLLRTGDVLGTQTVKKFVLLNSLTGGTSVNRSFNATGGVAALVTFTDNTQSVVYVGIP